MNLRSAAAGANETSGAKVYLAMWQCQSCQYQNEGWDEVCARCTAPRGASTVLAPPEAADSTVAQVAAPQGAGEAPAAGASAASAPVQSSSAAPPPGSPAAETGTANGPGATKPRNRLDALVTGLIVLCLVGLVVVGWLAVQGGFLRQILGQAEQAAKDQKDSAGAQVDSAADPLDMLNDRGVPKLKLFRDYAQILREVDSALQGKSVTGGAEPGTLSAESQQWIESLSPLADQLVLQYGNFETAAAANSEGELEKYKIMLREQFAARMNNLLEQVAQARSRDILGNLQAYMISDKLIGALDKYAQIDSAPLKDRWLTALHAREQLGLDQQNVEVYKQLEARLAALTQLHQDYSSSFADAPPYKIRNGYIDATAGKLLGLYNDLAVKIEEFTGEFEQYTGGLDPAFDSDRRRELVKQFTELAQEDHIYAFTETYKLYAKDKELSHPAYQELGKRVDFVREHWPDLESRYRVIYTKYEAAWDRRFKDAAGTNGSAPPTDWGAEEGGSSDEDGAGTGDQDGGEDNGGGGEDNGGGGESGGGEDSGGGNDSGGGESGGEGTSQTGNGADGSHGTTALSQPGPLEP